MQRMRHALKIDNDILSGAIKLAIVVAILNPGVQRYILKILEQLLKTVLLQKLSQEYPWLVTFPIREPLRSNLLIV